MIKKTLLVLVTAVPLLAMAVTSPTMAQIRILPGDQGVSSQKAQTPSTTHSVARGDTLWSIAQKYHTTTQKLIAANPQVAKRPNMLYVGEAITLPASETMSGYEQQVLTLTNEYRARNGKPLLKGDYSALNKSARVKAADMAQGAYFSHTSPSMGSPFDQMRAMGVTYTSAAENIAKGQQTPQQVVQAWINSPGHRANLLGNYTHMGVGESISNAGVYWCQQFVRR